MRFSSFHVYFTHLLQTELARSSVNEDPSLWLTESLASVMRGIEHLDKSGPTAIVDQCSEYPYGHFTVPICGLPVTNVDIRGRSSRRSQSKKAHDVVALAESQDYSVGASFSAETIDSAPEPPSGQSPVVQQSTGTVVSLPPLKSDSNATDQNGACAAGHSFADKSANEAT